jgi:tRNA 2-thiocytidine biosynthesis protein TtcA
MLTALQNVVPSHLMDRQLFPFETIEATGVADEDGDKAFDEEPVPNAAVNHRDIERPEPRNVRAEAAVIPIARAV